MVKLARRHGALGMKMQTLPTVTLPEYKAGDGRGRGRLLLIQSGYYANRDISSGFICPTSLAEASRLLNATTGSRRALECPAAKR